MNKIKIDLERRLGTIDPRIYSGFIEHLGRCIYGGIYDEGSPLSDEHGFRKDVLEALRPLNLPVLRWPGGNFVSAYHWTDGIGPVEKRPRRLELAWNTEESNRFGTDEFMQYCKVLGVEPYLCVNMGTGTIDEAQAWVEYCNGTGNTYWANLRRQNGQEEPYNVKYWGLGNEMYGEWQVGALSAEDYVKRAREFAKVMKWTDPHIQLVSCGQQGWNDWDRIVLEGLARYVDFHSIHIYTGTDNYYENVLTAQQAERAIKMCQALIDKVRFEQKIQHSIKIAYDEWNVWFMHRAGSQLEDRYSLADALAVSTYLNIFVRHCQSVGMANLAQMVNVIAPIFTSPEGLYLQTIYHPFRLFSQYMRGEALDIYVESETYAAEKDAPAWFNNIIDLAPFKLLDVSACYNPERKEVTVAVVNRDQERDLSTTIQFTDLAPASQVRVYEINHTDVNVQNSFEQPEAVVVQEREFESNGQMLEYVFPAHSLTMLRFQIG